MTIYPKMVQIGTHAAGDPGVRGGPLDLLRFVAAALIVIYHFQDAGPVQLEQFSQIFRRGYLATDFFLILSGYVLGRAYGGEIARGEIADVAFLLRRAARIWPAHLVVLAALAGVILLAGFEGKTPEHAGRFDWRDLPAQALLIQTWGFGRGGGWNLPTWSLSALLACYAAFPMLWRGLSQIRSGVLLFTLGLTGVALTDLMLRLSIGQSIYDLHFDRGVLRALPLFVFGACIAGGAASAARPTPGWWAAAAGAAVVSLQFMGRFDLLSVALMGLLIGWAGGAPAGRGAILAAQAARMSFSLYITHIFVGLLWFAGVRAAVTQFRPPSWFEWTLWGLALPVALVAAVVFERVVDRPLQRLSREALDRWLPSAARAPSKYPAGRGLAPRRHP